MELPQESLIAIVGQLGIGAIFLWLYLAEKKDRQGAESKKDSINGEVLQAFKQNTSITEKTKASLDANTETLKSLSQMVYDVIREKNK